MRRWMLPGRPSTVVGCVRACVLAPSPSSPLPQHMTLRPPMGPLRTHVDCCPTAIATMSEPAPPIFSGCSIHVSVEPHHTWRAELRPQEANGKKWPWDDEMNRNQDV